MVRWRFYSVGLILAFSLAGCGLLTGESPNQIDPAVDSENNVITQTPASEFSTALPTITATKMANRSLVITPTLTSTATPTATITPTVTPTPIVYRYLVQAGTPVRLVNFLYPELHCNWMGVGGQVFGMDELAQELVVVKVAGLLGGVQQMHLALTGLAPKFGPGGYEIKLADQPIESTETLSIQLFNVDGEPISEVTYFDTIGGDLGCEKNLVLINYNETSAGLDIQMHLPVILRDDTPIEASP